jgi:hypothetical protein
MFAENLGMMNVADPFHTYPLPLFDHHERKEQPPSTHALHALPAVRCKEDIRFHRNLKDETQHKISITRPISVCWIGQKIGETAAILFV